MSRYAYDYTIAPARPTGWRSVLTNLGVATAVALLSVISGAVVAYNLLVGEVRNGAASSVAAAPQISVPVQSPIRAPAARRVTVVPSIAAVPAPASQPAAQSQPAIQKVQQPAERPDVVGIVTAPALPQAPPSVPASQIDTASIASGDLTFAKGYALRRAAQAAASQAANKAAAKAPAANNTAAANAPTANLNVAAASEKQFGRPAVKRKPASVLAQNPRNDRYGMFERFDAAHHQALAFGDSSQPRPARRVNSGGWFDGMF